MESYHKQRHETPNCELMAHAAGTLNETATVLCADVLLCC